MSDKWVAGVRNPQEIYQPKEGDIIAITGPNSVQRLFFVVQIIFGETGAQQIALSPLDMER